MKDTKIITIHSFRGGTGKTQLLANLGAMMALSGKHVGVADLNVQAPGLHVLFGLTGELIPSSLNDYLAGRSEIGAAGLDVSSFLESESGKKLPDGSALIILPASLRPSDIGSLLKEGYDSQLLSQGLRSFAESFELDVLFLDTPPGLTGETLLGMALADTLLVLMRLDEQDFEGTQTSLDVIRQMELGDVRLIINQSPDECEADELKGRIENQFGYPVAAVVPYSEKILDFGSSGLLALQTTESPIVETLIQLSQRLAATEEVE